MPPVKASTSTPPRLAAMAPRSLLVADAGPPAAAEQARSGPGSDAGSATRFRARAPARVRRRGAGCQSIIVTSEWLRRPPKSRALQGRAPVQFNTEISGNGRGVCGAERQRKLWHRMGSGSLRGCAHPAASIRVWGAGGMKRCIVTTAARVGSGAVLRCAATDPGLGVR